MPPAGAAAPEPNGFVAPGFEPLAELFAASLGRGGGALALRRGDQVLVDICGGWADRARTRPWTPDTACLGFSVAKGLASTVLHRLADRGLLDYDAPVAAYWPEFAQAGKERVTVRQLLSHCAGLWDVRPLVREPGDWLDHLLMEERLAAAPITSSVGVPGYHAIAFGWLAAGLARKLTGRGMRQLVQEEIAEPLGLDGLHIGRPPSGVPIAETVGAMPELCGALVAFEPVWSKSPYVPGFLGALYAPGVERHIASGRILDTEMPSSNGMVTASGLCAMYAALANGGELGGRRLLSPQTARGLRDVQTDRRDRVILGAKMRWRLGYHQASGVPSRSDGAFGHDGIGGSTGWADQDTGLSYALVWNDVGDRVTTALRTARGLKISALAWELAQNR
ncbi:MAG: serine hydrolase domain-containing protein [Segniliparus sp.]|uniref:serine hydrolase domain-containing protein n=1 Tax=Segniliparus sp. TaxID=2804064 RepID=UPI003F2FD831